MSLPSIFKAMGHSLKLQLYSFKKLVSINTYAHAYIHIEKNQSIIILCSHSASWPPMLCGWLVTYDTWLGGSGACYAVTLKTYSQLVTHGWPVSNLPTIPSQVVVTHHHDNYNGSHYANWIGMLLFVLQLQGWIDGGGPLRSLYLSQIHTCIFSKLLSCT